jgi:hypothetical protein
VTARISTVRAGSPNRTKDHRALLPALTAFEFNEIFPVTQNIVPVVEIGLYL